METKLTGKVVVVAGASSGIGKAIALVLAKQGAKVVLGARRAEQLEEIVAEIRSAGGEAIYVVTDVRSRADLLQLVKQACDNFGGLDVIVNNAGVAPLSRIDAIDVEGWEAMVDINLKGVLYGMAAAIPVFQKQQSGHIVNIISTSGLKISPAMGMYAATKNAVRTSGGNSGIGFGTAKLFAAEGAKVVITGRNEKTLQSSTTEIGKAGN